jgi:hypothetical protein
MSYDDWNDGRLAGIEFAAKYFEGFIKSSLEPKQVVSTQIFPLCASMNRFAIANPSPMRDVVPSTRTNSSKIF